MSTSKWFHGRSKSFRALAASAALATLASGQEGGDETPFVPRIGLYVETHRLEDVRFVCRDAVTLVELDVHGASKDLDSFSLSSDGFHGVSVYAGRQVHWKAVIRSGARVPLLPKNATGLAVTPAQALEDRCALIADSGRNTVSVVNQRDFPESAPLVDAHTKPEFRLRDPQGLAASAEGDPAFYVADRGNHRVQKFSLAGEPLAQVGTRGTGEGKFIRPNDVAVDSRGCVYVVDTGNHRVQKFDAELNFLKAWGAFGPHPGFFAFPEGIDCFEDRLYVVDTDNHRVQVFDLEGALQYEWGLHALAPREGEGKLHYPRDVAVTRTPEGLVALVTEPFEDRFQVFRETKLGEELPKPTIPDRVIAAHFGPRLDIAEDLVAMFEPGAPSLLLYDIEHDVQPWEPIQVSRMAAWGRKIGQFRCPTDVAIDAARRLVYVADADSGVLASYRFAHTRESPLEYNPFEFKLVHSLDFAAHRELATPPREFAIQPAALELHPSGELYVLDSLQNAVFVFTPQLELARTIELANFAGAASIRLTDLAFSPDGKRLYVIDELRGDLCLVELEQTDSAEPRGARVSGLRDGPSSDESSRHFPRPGGIAVAPAGDVYITDLESHSIQRLDARGGWIATYGGPGIGRVQFHKPRGLDFDEQGRLWVVDWGNHRGQVLSPDGEFLAAFGSRLFTRPTR
jgi:DNA-binding beta-propeller fold protein YncE